jgi:carboxyl-terminal processing protease
LMNIAVEIASHFIPKWKLVVQSKYPWFTDEIYNSKWYWEFEWMKVVVLVDWLTASAWEILTLALQEQINATVLGTKTFGKWSIQTLHEFPDGASLKYTIGKRFPPSGLSVDEIGITPDIVVDFDSTWYINDDVDNQLEEAKNLFN